VQWFFDNLLPEEALRTRLAQEKKIAEADAFGLLEAYGAESAGALTLLKPGASLPPAGRRSLTEAELSKRVRDLPRISLEAKAPKKMSLAGAQHKLPVIVEGDAYFEPEGTEPSTHILKPNHPDVTTYPNSVVNEWSVMQLADRLGLRVPATSHRYCPHEELAEDVVPIFLIERFDRVHEKGKVRRLHAIDACQLLNIDRTYKLNSMTIETLQNVAEATRSRATTRLRLYQWALFNILVGNRDAHLKNLSFMVTATGIELSPHYDLLSTAVFDAGDAVQEWRNLEMSLALKGAARYADVTREAVLALAEDLGVGKQTAERMLDKMVHDAPIEMEALIKEFENRSYPASAKALRGGELRVLRQIRHVVMESMVRQLR
jgi:serine/threonine-protein kinase HipA